LHRNIGQRNGGFDISINSPNLFIKKTTLDLDVFGFKNNSGVIGTHYKSGWGIYPNLTLQSKKIKFQAGYWKAKKFVAPRGIYLFQSIAYFDNAFEQARQEHGHRYTLLRAPI
jgi:hypothetical protein